MPAAPSSPIDPAIGHLLAAVRSVDADPATVLSVLAAVADPRARRGIRHRLSTILTVAVCAVLAGARSFVAIAEWVADTDAETRQQLGIAGAAPCESTIRRTLQRLDADAFDDKVGAWAQQRTMPTPDRRRLIAVDGKTLRGSRSGDDPGRHLLAALDHTHGIVLGQVDVEAKTNEIPLFSTLLDRIQLTDAVVTADALHAQRGHATYLVDQRGAHYVLTVKGNQPSLHAQLAMLPWRDIPLADDARNHGHGRAEWRTLKVTSVTTGLLFPHAAQAIQIIRRRKPPDAKKWSTETVYAITSLTPAQASPAYLAQILRGHWTIENRLHWVRNVTLGEDLSQVRTSNGPQVMASIRNLVISILRLTGAPNIAAGLRHHSRKPHRPLETLNAC
jgi:predicted transposase YbfD/YdcC